MSVDLFLVFEHCCHFCVLMIRSCVAHDTHCDIFFGSFGTTTTTTTIATIIFIYACANRLGRCSRVFELSTVPLGAMSLFKAHPAWIAEYPGLYQTIRVVFAISFLLVRIVWSLPRMLLYLADTGTFIVGLPFPSLVQGYCFTNFFGALILFALQFWWGSMVVAGLTRFVLGRKVKQEPPKQFKDA